MHFIARDNPMDSYRGRLTLTRCRRQHFREELLATLAALDESIRHEGHEEHEGWVVLDSASTADRSGASARAEYSEPSCPS